MAKHGLEAYDVHIGNRIRLQRVALGMSQEKLADAVGLTFQQIQKYENGTNSVRGSRMVQVAQALGVPPAHFFEGLPGAGGKAATPETAAVERMAVSTGGADIARAFLKLSKRSRIALRSIAETLVEVEADGDAAPPLRAISGAAR